MRNVDASQCLTRTWEGLCRGMRLLTQQLISSSCSGSDSSTQCRSACSMQVPSEQGSPAALVSSPSLENPSFWVSVVQLLHLIPSRTISTWKPVSESVELGVYGSVFLHGNTECSLSLRFLTYFSSSTSRNVLFPDLQIDRSNLGRVEHSQLIHKCNMHACLSHAHKWHSALHSTL